jgi:hypothetical protein
LTITAVGINEFSTQRGYLCFVLAELTRTNAATDLTSSSHVCELSDEETEIGPSHIWAHEQGERVFFSAYT